MANLSTNQVRQLYVVKSVKALGVDIVDSDPEATLSVITSDPTKDPFGQKWTYINQKGKDGVVRGDMIKHDLVTYAKATGADDMRRGLLRYEVSLNPDINLGEPISGQTYKLNLWFREWVGVSPEDQYYKFGVVRATSTMTKAQFFIKMKESLELNFKREPNPVLTFTLDNDTTPTKLIIEEVAQPWQLGTMDSQPIHFTVTTDQVLINGDFYDWGIVTPVAPVNFVENGQVVANMEYFYHGERGDVYRNVCWPRVWRTEYQVDPNETYDVIDIRFDFQGENEVIQKSQKVLTLVMPTSVANLTTDVIARLTAAGLVVNTSPSL